jgi:hypothetical protein
LTGEVILAILAAESDEALARLRKNFRLHFPRERP